MKRPRVMRYLHKTYVLVGPFEFQYGHITGSLGFWFRRHYYEIKKGRC